ncbi:MAG: hypothetical protein QM784_16050 [Polyangiaceae bacterium]
MTIPHKLDRYGILNRNAANVKGATFASKRRVRERSLEGTLESSRRVTTATTALVESNATAG